MIVSIRNWFLLLALIIWASPSLAASLPIGLSINASGDNAQYSLDFKNGVDAFVTASSTKKRFGKSRLELVAMEDMGQPERFYANSKRLIKHKGVLALLTNHNLKAMPKAVDIAAKYKTLLLTTNPYSSDYSLRELEALGFLSNSEANMLKPAERLLEQANQVYLISEQAELSFPWYQALSKATEQPVYQHTQSQLNLLSKLSNSLFVLALDQVDSARLALDILTSNSNSNVLILPQTDTRLLANAINHKLEPQQLARLYYLNAAPLHLEELPLVKKFKQDMLAFNPQANLSHQALKGYLLASLVAESIFHSTKGLKTESFLDVVTLPFQVLDQMVGWVKHSGSDISSSEVLDTFARMKNFDAGLHKAVSVGEDRVLLGDTWLTQVDPQGRLIQASFANGRQF